MGVPIFIAVCSVLALDAVEAAPPPDPDRHGRALALTTAVVGGFAVYGALFWEYGESRPKLYREGWFGRRTQHGGMDKLGHAFTNHVGATLFATAYEEFGYAPRDASWLGGASAFASTLLMEVGDSFSPAHGFSPEDVAFNAVGASWSVLRRECPALARSVDFRLEYWPSPALRCGSGEDPSTDYAGQRYLLAIKGSALGLDRGGWRTALSLMEVHLGYYARGFEPTDRAGPPVRNLYAGLSVDLGGLLELAFGNRAGGVFSFYQPPYTSWRIGERGW